MRIVVQAGAQIQQPGDLLGLGDAVRRDVQVYPVLAVLDVG